MRTLLVAGRFDEHGGKPSGYARKLGVELHAHLPGTVVVNGGPIEDIPRAARQGADYYDVVLWMPDLQNDLPKYVEGLKSRNRKLLLVTSKRNLAGDDYSIEDVVARALTHKANLVLMVSGEREKVRGTVLDPLGVAHCLDEPDVREVARTLANRIEQLRSFTRVGSRSVGPAVRVPDEAEFFDLVRTHAERFHEVIHGVNHTRMLGNASFRCARGFPSFRQEGRIFVSRRNVDKRFIGREAFVAVEQAADGSVAFYGDRKPSVDTPIQLRLYDALPEVNYMLHSHTYIEGANCTEMPVPCGAVEEATLILRAKPQHRYGFAVNVLGHGSIYFAKDARSMRDIPWIARPIPELLPRCTSQRIQ
ncbi:hypothetical protein LCGC14_0413450 [marine sediment metagenome]|uniref:Class II aldolase/adducin N-terminal domain-containing protein n=1 Tax=marine sediment metagenome TaxID=412755 RepID=A0A0F9W2A2_9ZZZZ